MALNKRPTWVMLAAQLALWGVAAPRTAQAAEDDVPPSLEDVALMLGSSEREEVRQALEAAAMLGDPAVVPLMDQRIREGLPPALLAAALDSLSLLGDPATAPLWRELTYHRRADIRVRAVQGLVALGPQEDSSETQAALERALGDPHPEVRAAAARGLGELNLKDALPVLFTAFERGIPNSGPALAKVAGGEHLERVLGYLGQYPFENVSPILLGLLARSDLQDDAKLRIVAQIQEVATADARRTLERVANMEPGQISNRVRRAAAQSAQRISG